jgi:hypothetical protein
MLRSHLLLAATAAVMLVAGQAQATQCRNAAGKFVACPSAPAAPGQRCRAANGAFVKCSAPGAKPIASMTKTTTGKTMAAKTTPGKKTTVTAAAMGKTAVH